VCVCIYTCLYTVIHTQTHTPLSFLARDNSSSDADCGQSALYVYFYASFPEDHPEKNGKTYTPLSLLARDNSTSDAEFALEDPLFLAF
jgi:hypothetical protein